MASEIDKSNERWEKLRAGLYDAIYGKGLDQPYLDSTARLLDNLKSDQASLRTERDALAERVRELESERALPTTSEDDDGE